MQIRSSGQIGRLVRSRTYSDNSMPHLLEVTGLRTHFKTRAGLVRSVDDVSFHIDEGELLGLVGESGCGKSITALSVMRLISPPGRIVGGSIKFKGEELTTAA